MRKPGARTPRAWLGDSGSHLLGIVLLTTPVACAALVLPLADLARVAWLRKRAGEPIWVGDRRHLAHGLQARGLGPAAVVLVLVALALPPVVLLAVYAG
jgi:UDP-N-acetylmuramyl pentapeptide phosphotransferase/UDP-N-acetylglucosamine-1-phosphate transferase